jgi:hypothetical protein
MRTLLLSLSFLAACNSTMSDKSGDGDESVDTAGADARVEAAAYDLPGFRVYEDEGRLWIFQDGSKAHDSFLSEGEPAKRVSLIGAGPDGKTLYGADGDVMKAYADTMRYRTHGFVVVAAGDRLWVFRPGSAGHKEFVAKGEPAKRVALVGEGPDGKTLYAAEVDVARDFANTWKYRTEGFVVIGHEGRLWVFRAGSPAYADFVSKGEPAKRVTRVGAGPDGLTVLGADEEAIADFCAPHEFAQAGFAVIAEDGRLWIFEDGSQDHQTFLAMGEPAKSVTLVGAGPGGRTLRSTEIGILHDYMARWKYASPGFVVLGRDGRLWVFKAGSEAYRAFLEHGEPAKRVTLVGAGPDGKTLMGASKQTLQEYAQGVSPQ